MKPILNLIPPDGRRQYEALWQPARLVTPEPGQSPYEVAPGYVVVSECDVPQEVEG
jgi:hypothetical protein